MAKSQDTFSKKDREKQRKRKQQDKREKMKERKNNNSKGKSLEQMMAYLDENGNLTSKPQDPRKKIDYDLESISISVPKQEAQPADALRAGIVTFFNDHKGFGFINDAKSHERIFFHVNDLAAPVKENDKVSYTVQKSHKGPVAMNVALIKN
ncbi:cold-shock protein [Longitalea luteola]|uniref:cold-shock protein n=1 Tax=Longitalea luteola TaxID=2812563 RepID=UPI001A96D6E6|nr:cold shock domain-containing protein [Longitalea luteola]